MCWDCKDPATTNERRKTQCRGNKLRVDDYEIKIRASRNFKNLPDSWDEVIVMGAGRSWKNYRKTRWKTKV